jgi:hypothetical protein
MRMQMTLPDLDFKASAQLRPGSLIEYEYTTGVLADKTARAIALVARVDWRPRHTRSCVWAVAGSGALLCIDICNVCQLIIP